MIQEQTWGQKLGLSTGALFKHLTKNVHEWDPVDSDAERADRRKTGPKNTEQSRQAESPLTRAEPKA